MTLAEEAEELRYALRALWRSVRRQTKRDLRRCLWQGCARRGSLQVALDCDCGLVPEFGAAWWCPDHAATLTHKLIRLGNVLVRDRKGRVQTLEPTEEAA